MILEDFHEVSIDIEKLIRMCLKDPEIALIVRNAICSGVDDSDAYIGESVCADDLDKNKKVYAFLETSKYINPGSAGHVSRVNQSGHIKLVLKRQEVKSHAAQIPGDAMPQLLGETGNLLRTALSGCGDASAALVNFSESSPEKKDKKE